jgi:hypothetical protein
MINQAKLSSKWSNLLHWVTIYKLNTLQKHINKSSNKLESILLGLFSCTSVALLDTLLAVPTS